MPYFKRIDSFGTYEGHDSDFHYDYNANSGGGQAFLGGSFEDSKGTLHSAKDLEGKIASFVFRYHGDDGAEHLIDLGTDLSAQMEVTPRSAGNSNMKLALEHKTRPSLLFPALLMLPRTCGRNMADSLSRSTLTLDNYWLRSMWLDVETIEGDAVRFAPRDYVFEGGSSKKKGVSDGKTVIGEPRFFLLDHEHRSNDIVRIAEHSAVFPSDIAEILRFFGRLLLGKEVYSYDKCSSMTQELMSLMASYWPEQYSGVSDPLPLLMRMSNCPEGGAHERGGRHPISEPRNLIYFGAPGTGKSYELNKKAGDCFSESNVSRVTFYPDYTYSQFVGCFKPVTRYKDSSDKPASEPESYISYEFVPGPFLETYVKAVQNPDENFLLIVEEINRANPASVFGDVFQLLDRGADGRSEYEVAAPREMRDHLSVFLSEYATNGHATDPVKLFDEQHRLSMETERLSLPPNMYIWATMNSADQGVFPMDTAFKRRWDFRYMGIDEGENADVGGKALSEIEVPCGKRTVVWNRLRHAINEFMASDDLRINEDKLLGPFFIAPSALTLERFPRVFKDKVLLYLYEDAGKTKRTKMFKREFNTYAKVCEAFDRIGVGIFGNGFDDHLVYGHADDADDVDAGE